MNIATVENLPAQSNRAVSNSWRIAQGVIWGGLAVVVLSGWFVVARLGLRQDLRVWDVMALRFGEGALFLTPVLLVGPLRLRVQAWPSGIILALLWGAPCILLVGLGLQATSATMTSTVTPALIPVFAGFVAWTFFGEPPSRRQLSGYGMIAAGLFALVCIYVQATGRLDMRLLLLPLSFGRSIHCGCLDPALRPFRLLHSSASGRPSSTRRFISD